jgi:hypothetical protein
MEQPTIVVLEIKLTLRPLICASVFRRGGPAVFQIIMEVTAEGLFKPILSAALKFGKTRVQHLSQHNGSASVSSCSRVVNTVQAMDTFLSERLDKLCCFHCLQLKMPHSE